MAWIMAQAAEKIDALVIGAGPAGLMAAEALSAAGNRVVIAEALPSPARKFLMAGKSGLNLTKDEDPAVFLAAFGAAADRLRPMLHSFGPSEVQAWARGLGIELFTGSTRRVFPTAMKASPLLRAWLGRLQAAGAELRRGWRWTGWDGGAVRFDTADGPRWIDARAEVLALGGASWPRLGSTGDWAALLAAEGVPVVPFKPANGGIRVEWTSHMARHFGTALKAVAMQADGIVSRGECVITKDGLEGGGVYALTPAIRVGAELRLDLKPDRDLADVTTRLGRPRGKASLRDHLRRSLNLSPAAIALLQECARPLPEGPALAALVKALQVPHRGAAPLVNAISTAGGVGWDGLDADLMLRARPGSFAAGEMLDWEAPTGGYLLTACMATGLHAGRAAAAWLSR